MYDKMRLHASLREINLKIEQAVQRVARTQDLIQRIDADPGDLAEARRLLHNMQKALETFRAYRDAVEHALLADEARSPRNEKYCGTVPLPNRPAEQTSFRPVAIAGTRSGRIKTSRWVRRCSLQPGDPGEPAHEVPNEPESEYKSLKTRRRS